MRRSCRFAMTVGLVVRVALFGTDALANQALSTQANVESVLQALRLPSTFATVGARAEALARIESSESLRSDERIRVELIAALDLANKEYWKRLELAVDRAEFITHLESVRRLRNDVMHFNPDGLDDDQRKKLRNVARFFDQLANMTAAS